MSYQLIDEGNEEFLRAIFEVIVSRLELKSLKQLLMLLNESEQLPLEYALPRHVILLGDYQADL